MVPVRKYRGLLLYGAAMLVSLVALISYSGGLGQATIEQATIERTQKSEMRKKFVFIFREGSRKLSSEEQKQRTEEVRGWALQQLKDGRNFEPRVLEEESYQLGQAFPQSSTDGRVIALNFIEASDFAEAVKIAQSHPGLRYGVRIEVRAWNDPRAQARPK